MQTLREIAGKALVEKVVLDGREELQLGGDLHKVIIWWLEAAGLAEHRVLDGAAVAMDLEAGRIELGREMNRADDSPSHMATVEAVTTILAACGIIVPDASGTGRLCVEWDSWPWLEDKDGETVFDLYDDGGLQDEGQHYTITVTRKSISHPQVTERE